MSYLRKRYGRSSLGDGAVDATSDGVCCFDGDPVTGFAAMFCNQKYPNGWTCTSQGMQCLDAANQVTGPLDAKIQDLAHNWQAPDNIAPQDLRNIVSSVLAVVQQAQNAVDQSASQPNANQSDLQQATDDLTRHGQVAIDFTSAANQADAGGVPVQAPNLKTWILNTLDAASSAMVTAYTVSCTTPWWVGALAAFQAAFDTCWRVIKEVVNVVIAAGSAVIKTAAGVVGLVEWLSANLKWIALGGAALLVYSATEHGRGIRERIGL